MPLHIYIKDYIKNEDFWDESLQKWLESWQKIKQPKAAEKDNKRYKGRKPFQQYLRTGSSTTEQWDKYINICAVIVITTHSWSILTVIIILAFIKCYLLWDSSYVY